jgi:hypothetical protein
MVLHNFFEDLKNIDFQLKTQSKGLTFGFTNRHLFTAKTSQKFIFQPR